MEWRIWITFWIIFFTSYSRLFWIYVKKAYTDNPSIRKCTNEIENRITFKIKTGYYLELLIPEAKKLLGGTKSKIKKDENGKNIPYLEITEVVLVHFNVVNNSYQQNSRVLYTFVRSIIRYFICKFYVFKNIWFRIFICQSMIYWSNF